MTKKTEDFSISAEITKVDSEKRVVYGWASVIEKDGNQIVDHQGHIIEINELTTAAHDFMLESRVGKEMHDGSKVSDVVESVIFSNELQDSLGIDLGKVGWMIGMKIHDDATLLKFKNGELKDFSIGGRGVLEDA